MSANLSQICSEQPFHIRYYQTVERLIEKYQSFFGRKLLEEGERGVRLSRKTVEEGGIEIVNHLSLKYYLKWAGISGLEALYLSLTLPEIGIRAAYKQLERV